MEVVENDNDVKPLCTSDLIVYEEEVVDENEIVESQMIKVEMLNEIVYTDTEYIEEDKLIEVPPVKIKKPTVISLPQPRTEKQPPTQPDTADDQRIRNTANMFCDICSDPFDSLRDAKAHYKLAHNTDGYILCCDR